MLVLSQSPRSPRRFAKGSTEPERASRWPGPTVTQLDLVGGEQNTESVELVFPLVAHRAKESEIGVGNGHLPANGAGHTVVIVTGNDHFGEAAGG